MDVANLLLIARETVGQTPCCFAVTTTEAGEMNARVVQPRKPDADWNVRFMTRRSSRKTREIEQTGKLLLAYQHDPEAAYVTLRGPAEIIDDVAVKRSVWTTAADKWYPDGPEDPDVVLVELRTERIELWNAARKVMPAPKGFSAAVLTRDNTNWTFSTT